MKPFDWENYLYFAEDLSYDKSEDEADLEAALRSAISRAYYAAFNLAQKLLDDKGMSVSSELNGKHERLWDTFTKGPNRTWRDIGASGERLRRKRVGVDYFLDRKTTQVWRNEAKSTVTAAQNILTWIEQIYNHSE